jgi:hypothetical protein
MMILIHVDFFGSDDELSELDKALELVGTESEGVEFLGRYDATQLKWHYTYFFRAESRDHWFTGESNWKYKKDKSKMTHSVIQYFV